MIKDMTPLSMSESLNYIKNPEVKAFVKSFSEIKEKKAEELRKKLTELNLIKLNEKHISKLIDFLPEEKEEVQRILPDSNLDEDETNTIISTIKEFN